MLSADADPIYLKLLDRYGEEYCRLAGYFDETKPFGVPYGEVFKLPTDKIVIQFSGAFHPFHAGHFESLQRAITHVRYVNSEVPLDICVVIHADHAEYRQSKGDFPTANFYDAFKILETLDCQWMLVDDDSMPNGCSRNFTRLYGELVDRNHGVYFLSGGDRANFALTFRDDGYCIISGRDQAPMFKKYDYLSGFGSNIQFIPGNNPLSSTEVRAKI